MAKSKTDEKKKGKKRDKRAEASIKEMQSQCLSMAEEKVNLITRAEESLQFNLASIRNQIERTEQLLQQCHRVKGSQECVETTLLPLSISMIRTSRERPKE